MRSDLKWMISIYIFAFIFVAIGSTIRYNTDFGEGILDSEDKVFFGVKNIWGYLHLLLYSLLGYKCGLRLLPVAFIVSILFEETEMSLQDVSNNVVKGNPGVDTFIDMTGYLGGVYIKYLIT